VQNLGSDAAKAFFLRHLRKICVKSVKISRIYANMAKITPKKFFKLAPAGVKVIRLVFVTDTGKIS
jgi:hypothetical protein